MEYTVVSFTVSSEKGQGLAGKRIGGELELDVGALTICWLWPISRIRRVDGNAAFRLIFGLGIVSAALRLLPLHCLRKPEGISDMNREHRAEWVGGWVGERAGSATNTSETSTSHVPSDQRSYRGKY